MEVVSHEKRHSRVYDFVIMLRTDVLFFAPVVTRYLSTSRVHANNEALTLGRAADQFAVVPRRLLWYYSAQLNALADVKFQEKCNFCVAEKLQDAVLKHYNVSIQAHRWSYQVMRSNGLKHGCKYLHVEFTRICEALVRSFTCSSLDNSTGAWGVGTRC